MDNTTAIISPLSKTRKMRTEKQALKLSIRVWNYLASHPNVYTKEFLPQKLFRLIKEDAHYCPLCTLYLRDIIDSKDECVNCPLSKCGEECNSRVPSTKNSNHTNFMDADAYSQWCYATDRLSREFSAKRMVKLLTQEYKKLLKKLK